MKKALDLFVILKDIFFWPLDDPPAYLMKLLGEPYFIHGLRYLSSFFSIRKLVFIYRDNTYISTIQRILEDNVSTDISFELVKDFSLKTVLDTILSLRNEDHHLISYTMYDPIYLLDLTYFENTQFFVSKDSEGKITYFFVHLKPGETLSNEKKAKTIPFFSPTYPWDFLRIFKKTIHKKIKSTRIRKSARISDSAKIIGPCWIDENATIYENAVIKGPTYIGKNTIIGNNALIRGSSIEQGSIVGANMEIARSWLGVRSETHSGYIGDSIFVNKVHVGAGFITGNVRLDRKTVKTKWKNQKIDTNLEKFGTIIGSNTEIGIHSGTMPGVLIGKNVLIGPGTLVFENVPDNTIIYTKQPIILKKRLINIGITS